ncbi:MAG: hypothetical protein SNJ67_07835 [Chloracidobacterium sp.]|uniref:Uncharacterized protein n=1 Tax=Chloracidobacterium validum TaxID=2821543 RepID=A0ABX8B843_9BACT|nr:hypothetical protein [Chloracidobacterium validum]QUW02226.1 hypothetical protein J8C06_07605 [Chloracidobacterium validum]
MTLATTDAATVEVGNQSSPLPRGLKRETIELPGGEILEYDYFSADPATMTRLTDLLFKEHWREIVVGPCIQGAVFEVRFEQAPDVTFSDGYLTVDLGYWHFHLCTGVHKHAPTPEVARQRQVAQVAFFLQRGQRCGGGRSWGLRLWNGLGEQMTTVFLPNPYLTDDMRVRKNPDWNRLGLWHKLREIFLGEPIPPDLVTHYNQEPIVSLHH